MFAIYLQRNKKLPSVLGMTLNNLMVKLETWLFEEYEVLLHYHYSLYILTQSDITYQGHIYMLNRTI